MQTNRLTGAGQRRDLQTRMELAFPWVKLVARWTQPEKIKPDQLPREAELAHPAILPCIMAPMRSRYQAPDFRAARSRLANAVIRDFARLRLRSAACLSLALACPATALADPLAPGFRSEERRVGKE